MNRETIKKIIELTTHEYDGEIWGDDYCMGSLDDLIDKAMKIVENDSLKLYVWEGVLTDYTDGIMFALAENEDEAKELIRKKEKDFWGHSESVDIEFKRVLTNCVTNKSAFVVYGGG